MKQYFFSLSGSLFAGFIASMLQSLLGALFVDESNQSIGMIAEHVIRQPLGLYFTVAGIVSVSFPFFYHARSRLKWESDGIFLAWGMCTGGMVVLWPILTMKMMERACGNDSFGYFLLCVGNTIVFAPAVAGGAIFMFSYLLFKHGKNSRKAQ